MQFDVIDTGIGMTEEQAARIFNPFAQADLVDHAPVRRHGPGADDQQAVRRSLGGGIQCESTAGVGSLFRVPVQAGPLEGVEYWTQRKPAATSSVQRRERQAVDLRIRPVESCWSMMARAIENWSAAAARVGLTHG